MSREYIQNPSFVQKNAVEQEASHGKDGGRLIAGWRRLVIDPTPALSVPREH
jgi:hypothetical protein